MDPTLVKLGTDAVVALEAEAKTFMQAVVGEPAKELGGLLKDKISAIRHSNLVRTVVSAKRKLEDAGLSPKEVPLKIIHPLLESASLEQEPKLQERWANLLANAADASKQHHVRGSFVQALSELTTADAVFLNTWHDGDGPLAPSLGYSLLELDHFYPHADSENTTSRKIPSETMLISLDALEKNGLVSKLYSIPLQVNGENVGGVGYSVTHLGVAFIEACRAPHMNSKDRR